MHSRNVVKLPRREPEAEPWQSVLEHADAEIETLRADLDAERELRQEAEAEARRLGAVVESSDDAIFSLTPEGRIETWNPGAERLFGYTGEEALGRPVTLIALEPGAAEALGGALERVRTGERVAGREAVALGRGDRRIDVALTASPILDATGAIAGVSCVARDIAERKRFEAKLRHLADHDSVTGLANRRRFEETLAAHLSRPDRADGAVLILDLDDFKLINDRLGHRAGDEALEALARLAQRSLGPRSILARLGGDELGALLPGADAVGAEAAALALLEGVRDLSLVVDGRQVHLEHQRGRGAGRRRAGHRAGAALGRRRGDVRRQGGGPRSHGDGGPGLGLVHRGAPGRDRADPAGPGRGPLRAARAAHPGPAHR